VSDKFDQDQNEYALKCWASSNKEHGCNSLSTYYFSHGYGVLALIPPAEGHTAPIGAIANEVLFQTIYPWHI